VRSDLRGSIVVLIVLTLLLFLDSVSSEPIQHVRTGPDKERGDLVPLVAPTWAQSFTGVNLDAPVLVLEHVYPH